MKFSSLRQLRAFSAVARHQSFLLAAAEMHVTPSAVSLQIKELERSLRVTLFRRRGRRSSLTPDGERILADVNRALQALQDAESTAERLRQDDGGSVSVGIVTNANYFMPRLLSRFHGLNPAIDLRISVANRRQLIDSLRDGQIDLAIMGEPPTELETRCVALATQPLGILARSDHPLAARQAIEPAALGACTLLVREVGSGTRAAMEQFFRACAVVPRSVLELTSNDTIKQSVIAGLGLAFISLHTAAEELRAGQLVMLDIMGLPLLRRWNLVRLRSHALTRTAAVLEEFIAAEGGALIAQQFAGVL